MSAPGWQLGEMMEETLGAFADAAHALRSGAHFAHEALSGMDHELLGDRVSSFAEHWSYEARRQRYFEGLTGNEPEGEEA